MRSRYSFINLHIRPELRLDMEEEGWAVGEKEGRRTALWLLTIELGDLRIRTSWISESAEGVEVIERINYSVIEYE